jgi:dTDP-4-dehydrorhamnose 3,5-epimerase
MKFHPTRIHGAFVIEQQRIHDHRGYFARQWCAAELEAQGLEGRNAQINVQVSQHAGTLRGMHYQRPPHAEVKIASCQRGAAFDVAVDLRHGSPTFRQWFGVEISADNGFSLYLPEGCAHGYLTLRDDTLVTYSTTCPYVPAAATGVRHDDPAFAIDWPRAVSVISDADCSWPLFKP